MGMLLLVARFKALLPALGLVLISSSQVQAKEIGPPLAGGTPDQSPLHAPEPAVARLLHELQSFTEASLRESRRHRRRRVTPPPRGRP